LAKKFDAADASWPAFDPSKTNWTGAVVVARYGTKVSKRKLKTIAKRLLKALRDGGING